MRTFVLLIILFNFNYIKSCGMTTHIEISRRAFLNFKPVSKHNNEYNKFIAEHPSFFAAGSPWPDWGYTCGFHEEGEYAHWPPFIYYYTKYLRDNYKPTDTRYKQLTSFLFGVESHQIADVVWHWGKTGPTADAQGFLNSMAHGASNCEDVWNDSNMKPNCHTMGDVGADFYLANRGGLNRMSNFWTVPVKDMEAVYKLAGSQVPAIKMTECAVKMYAGTILEKVAGLVALFYFEEHAAFLADNLDLWYHGGLDDMAIHVNWQWQTVIDLLENDDDLFKEKMNKGLTMKQENKKKSIQHQLIRKIVSSVNFEHFKQLAGINFETQDNGDINLTFKHESLVNNLTHLVEKITNDLFPKLNIENLTKKFNIISPSVFLLNKFKSNTYTSHVKYSYFGKSVAFGDFNGDGERDIAIGAHGYGHLQQGAVYVLNNKDFTKLNYDKPTFVGEVYSRFGFSLTTVDINNDGIDDLVVSAPSFGKNGPSDELDHYYPKEYNGLVYVYYGRQGTGLNSTPDVTILGDNDEGIFQNLGLFLSSGDCDGDGFADLLIGSPLAESGGNKRGSAAVFTFLPTNTTTINIGSADFLTKGTDDFQEHGSMMLCKDNTVFVGVPGYRPDGNRELQASGAVIAYNLKDKEVIFKIESDKSQARFGASFDLFGNYLAVGSPSFTGEGKDRKHYNSGRVFIFDITKLTKDSTISQSISQIVSEDRRARFGWVVKFYHSGALIISSPMHSENIFDVETGRIFIFNNITQYQNELTNDKANHIINHSRRGGRFGYNIQIDGDEVYASSPFDVQEELSGSLVKINHL